MSCNALPEEWPHGDAFDPEFTWLEYAGGPAVDLTSVPMTSQVRRKDTWALVADVPITADPDQVTNRGFARGLFADTTSWPIGVVLVWDVRGVIAGLARHSGQLEFTLGRTVTSAP